MENVQTKIGIAYSTYNSNITQRLLEGAKSTLQQAGYEEGQLLIAEVPGAWELALAARRFLDREDVVGVLALF